MTLNLLVPFDFCIFFFVCCGSWRAVAVFSPVMTELKHHLFWTSFVFVKIKFFFSSKRLEHFQDTGFGCSDFLQALLIIFVKWPSAIKYWNYCVDRKTNRGLGHAAPLEWAGDAVSGRTAWGETRGEGEGRTGAGAAGPGAVQPQRPGGGWRGGTSGQDLPRHRERLHVHQQYSDASWRQHQCNAQVCNVQHRDCTNLWPLNLVAHNFSTSEKAICSRCCIYKIFFLNAYHVL